MCFVSGELKEEGIMGLLIQEWLAKNNLMGCSLEEVIKKWYQFRTAESLSLANSKYH